MPPAKSKAAHQKKSAPKPKSKPPPKPKQSDEERRQKIAERNQRLRRMGY